MSTQTFPHAAFGATHEHASERHSAPPSHTPAQHGVPGTPHIGGVPLLLALPLLLLALPLLLLLALIPASVPVGLPPVPGSSPTQA